MSDLITTLLIGCVTAVTTGLVIALAIQTLPWLLTKFTSRALAHGPDTFLPAGQFDRVLRYYMEPMCKFEDEFFLPEKRLFKTLDAALMTPEGFRRIVLLAGSGMGKSSALANYYARHLRRSSRTFDIAIIHLGILGADLRIGAIEGKPGTVLFLDGLDEDALAGVDPLRRFHNIIDISAEFRAVVITCRSRFFEENVEGDNTPTRAVKSPFFRAASAYRYDAHAKSRSGSQIRKLFLSGFGGAEIKMYIRKLYPPWCIRLRRCAYQMSYAVPEAFRPMLLAHIPHFQGEPQTLRSSAVLYGALVEGLLGLRQSSHGAGLHKLSESLAVDAYLNRAQRGAERVTLKQIEELARDNKVHIGLSRPLGFLLDKDACGYYSFAHRSIMEYLIVMALLRGDNRCIAVAWTDLMRDFLYDLVESGHRPVGVSSLIDRHALRSTFRGGSLEKAVAVFCRSIAPPANILVINTESREGVLINGLAITNVKWLPGQCIDDLPELSNLCTSGNSRWSRSAIIRGARFHRNSRPYAIYVGLREEHHRLVIGLLKFFRYLDKHVTLIDLSPPVSTSPGDFAPPARPLVPSDLYFEPMPYTSYTSFTESAEDRRLGDYEFHAESYSLIQEGLRALSAATKEWNARARQYGASFEPYGRDAARLQIMIDVGDQKLARERHYVPIRGMSTVSMRYFRAGLELIIRRRRAGISGWPREALRSVKASVEKLEILARDLGAEPADLLWEVLPHKEMEVMAQQIRRDAASALWDVFISHASEDKEQFVRPLADELTKAGLRVWYDDFSLRVGDSLRRSIDKGISRSRFGVVVLSPRFFAKEWALKELDGLFAREIEGVTVILPVWHEIDVMAVRSHSPTLADKVAINSNEGIERVVRKLVAVLKP